MDPATVNETTHLAQVLRTMQLDVSQVASASAVIENLQKLSVHNKSTDGAERAPEEYTPYPHIFAIGDAADAFGAIAAGHTAYAQGEVAASNIIRLIKLQEAEETYLADIAKSGSETEIVKPEHEPLQYYTPGPPAIKVSLGLVRHHFYSPCE